MLSILIPTYNYSITKLVNGLHNQCLQCKVPFEIIIIDDCSSELFKKTNATLKELSHVSYTELEQNIGRSKIRNELASKAQYPYLLFMDCDAKIPSDSYISNYLNYCKAEVIICGGTAYESTLPNPNESLRWHYGRSREQRLATERNQNPNASFTTFNFLISASIFNQITFNESITKYGHEDTLFGYELKIRNFVITHIDNPLIHMGLDSNIEFIRKTKTGIQSLFALLNNPSIDQKFSDDITLIRAYKKIKKYKLRLIIALIYKISAKTIEKQLCKKTPNIRLFDILKLGYICSL